MTMTPYMLERQKMKLKGAGKAANDPEPERTGKSKTSTQKPAKGLKTGKKRKLKRVSAKRAKQERAYKPVRKKFLQEHPTCEAGLEDCLGIATQIHHSGGREGERLLKVDDFKALCENCHRKITDQSRQAIAAGHSKSRLGKPEKQIK